MIMVVMIIPARRGLPKMAGERTAYTVIANICCWHWLRVSAYRDYVAIAGDGANHAICVAKGILWGLWGLCRYVCGALYRPAARNTR